MALVISEAQTRKLIDMQTALKLVDGMFRARAAGKVRSVPRRRLKGSEKQLNMMAAWHETSDLICLRAYAGASNTVTLYNGRTGADSSDHRHGLSQQPSNGRRHGRRRQISRAGKQQRHWA